MPPYRRNQRIPIRLFIDQYRGQEHWIGMSFNLSAGGLYLCQRPHAIPGEMGLELDLPGLDESLWTRAEVRFVETQGRFMGVGVAFTAMARKHQSLLQDWVGSVRKRLRTNERRSATRQLLAA